MFEQEYIAFRITGKRRNSRIRYVEFRRYANGVIKAHWEERKAPCMMHASRELRGKDTTDVMMDDWTDAQWDQIHDAQTYILSKSVGLSENDIEDIIKVLESANDLTVMGMAI